MPMEMNIGKMLYLSAGLRIRHVVSQYYELWKWRDYCIKNDAGSSVSHFVSHNNNNNNNEKEPEISTTRGGTIINLSRKKTEELFNQLLLVVGARSQLQVEYRMGLSTSYQIQEKDTVRNIRQYEGLLFVTQPLPN